MAALLAFVATVLTSLLPILNKRLLQDARPALVAWVVNAASLPILLAGTLCGIQRQLRKIKSSSGNREKVLRIRRKRLT